MRGGKREGVERKKDRQSVIETEEGRERERERERERGREGDGMLQENDERVHTCMAAGECPKDIYIRRIGIAWW